MKIWQYSLIKDHPEAGEKLCVDPKTDFPGLLVGLVCEACLFSVFEATHQPTMVSVPKIIELEADS